MMNVDQDEDGREHRRMEDPWVAGLFFQSSGWMAWLWFVLRVWLGIQWLTLGWAARDDTPIWPALLHFVLGVLLVVGAFVGIAAAVGVVTNVLAFQFGSGDLDPLHLVAALFLILAWKNAGYVGADRYLLRLFGAPWSTTQVPHVSRRARAAPARIKR